VLVVLTSIFVSGAVAAIGAVVETVVSVELVVADVVDTVADVELMLVAVYVALVAVMAVVDVGPSVEVMQAAKDIRTNKVCGSAKTISPKSAWRYVWHDDVSSLNENDLHLSPADRHSSAHASTDCTLTRSSRTVLSYLIPAMPLSKKLSDGPPQEVDVAVLAVLVRVAELVVAVSDVVALVVVLDSVAVMVDDVPVAEVLETDKFASKHASIRPYPSKLSELINGGF
jgi:hypothetical protein